MLVLDELLAMALDDGSDIHACPTIVSTSTFVHILLAGWQ